MSAKKALLVGCNYASDPQIRLNGCINDIVNISTLLTEQFHYEKKNIKELRDDDPNSLPTRANILRSLIDLVNESAKLSEIWFHYSGHGSQVFDMTNTIKEGIEEVIVPLDYQTAGFIIDLEIFNILQKAQCKVMLIFDCCHSGSVCDLEWSFEYKNGDFIKYQIDDKEIKNPDIFCFSGCKDSQTSADAFSPRSQRSFGAFTDAFIHCLKNNEYEVSLLKLYADICTLVKTEGYEQTPNLSSSSQHPNYLFSKSLLLKENPFAFPPLPIKEGGWATAANRDIITPPAPFSSPRGAFQVMKMGSIKIKPMLDILQRIQEEEPNLQMISPTALSFTRTTPPSASLKAPLFPQKSYENIFLLGKKK
jgi:hypothetical protein